MDLYLGLGVCLVGVVCVVAGVQGRGAQLFTTATGQAILGAKVASAGTSSAVYAGGTAAGTTPAGQVTFA